MVTRASPMIIICLFMIMNIKCSHGGLEDLLGAIEDEIMTSPQLKASATSMGSSGSVIINLDESQESLPHLSINDRLPWLSDSRDSIVLNEEDDSASYVLFPAMYQSLL